MLEGNKIKFVNGKVVTIKLLDARRLHLDTSNIAFIKPKMDKDNNHIISISLEDKFIIKKNDKIKASLGGVTTIYEVVYMVIEKNEKSVIIYSALPTKTELFLLPLLGKTKGYLMFDNYFVNAQLDHTHEFLCLRYRFTGTETYMEFEKKMLTDPLCTLHIDHNKHHVIYVFKIPSRFKKDVVSFLEGKYSKLSKALVAHLKTFHGRDDVKMLLEIINQNEDLKKRMERYIGTRLPPDSELASKPNMNIEIYIPKTLKDE